MYQVNVNDSEQYQIEEDHADFILDGKAVNLDVIRESPQRYQVFQNNRSHLVEILKVDRQAKAISLKINGKTANVALKTNLDQLLEKLGMDQASTQGLQDLKAPMPGLILQLNVSEGQEVKKGDALLILEAMKMENVIKAQGDGVVKSILVKEKQSVEKNQVIVEFGG